MVSRGCGSVGEVKDGHIPSQGRSLPSGNPKLYMSREEVTAAERAVKPQL